MIEVNLMPGGKPRRSRKKESGAWSLNLTSLRKLDRTTTLLAASWVLGPLVIAWLFLDARARHAALAIEVERAVRDSARHATLIKANSVLQARQDTIAQKLQIIRQVDTGRYVWPHILDELSSRLPEHTWLTGVGQTQGGPLPAFRVEGRAGSTFALTRYMTELEASPFIRGVRMRSTELVREGEKLIYRFMLDASYQEPPPKRIETTRLFAVPEDGKETKEK